MRRRVLVATTGLLLLGSTPAGANHIAGATYTGFHAHGGSITFTVSDTGRVINDFTIAGPVVGADGCTILASGASQTVQSAGIESHTFAHDPPPLASFGGFPAPQGAGGTLLLGTSFASGCDSGPLVWSAATAEAIGCRVPDVAGKKVKRARPDQQVTLHAREHQAPVKQGSSEGVRDPSGAQAARGAGSRRAREPHGQRGTLSPGRNRVGGAPGARLPRQW